MENWCFLPLKFILNDLLYHPRVTARYPFNIRISKVLTDPSSIVFLEPYFQGEGILGDQLEGGEGFIRKYLDFVSLMGSKYVSLGNMNDREVLKGSKGKKKVIRRKEERLKMILGNDL